MKINNQNRAFLYEQLLNGLYLVQTINIKGKRGYKLYKGNQIPVRWISANTAAEITPYLKKDSKGRFTLNKSSVRQLHGGNKAKRLYKAAVKPKEKKLSRSIEFME